MLAERTTVLLILSRDTLDRARVLAGRMTTTLRLAVSLQIVLRALIEEGLKDADDPGLVKNMTRQAETVRERRAAARRGAAASRKRQRRVRK